MTDLNALLLKIRESANAPDDRPLSLPPEAYTLAALLQLEREQVFRKEWICVGREDEIARPGAWFASQIDSVPILVARQKDGTIAALSAVCRHRLATVATGRGEAQGFSCPYHGWTYDLDGGLMTAPRMPKEFCRDGIALERFRTETWNGFIYVSLDPSAAPLSPQLSSVAALLGPYHVERMKTLRRERHVWRTNWKVLAENFLEAYHLPATHTRTLAPIAPTGNVTLLEEGPAHQFYAHRFAAGYQHVQPDPAIAIPNDELTVAQRDQAYIGGVFPGHLFSVAWDWVFWLALQPLSVNEVAIDMGLAAPVDFRGEPVDPSHPSLYFWSLVDAVNSEDRLRVEAVQVGAESGVGARCLLHPHERTLRGFAQYLVRALRVPEI